MPTISRAWKAGTAVGDLRDGPELRDWLLAGETLKEMPRRKRRSLGLPLLLAAIGSVIIVCIFAML